MSFDGQMVHLIQKMYSEPSARIILEQGMSGSFMLQKGTRQGCPLLPLLFNLAIKPLPRYILINQGLLGIKIGELEVKSALFADDVLLFSSAANEDVPEKL